MAAQGRRILIIDDDPDITRLLVRVLSRDDEKTITDACHTLGEGLERLAADEYDALALDLGLPDGSGVGNVLRVREQAPELPIVVVSGIGDEEVIFEAMQNGAQDYLIKGPLVPKMLSRALHYAISRKNSESEVQSTMAKLRRTLMGTVNVLATMIELRDPYTAGHERRVSQLACAIAPRMGLDEDHVEGLRVAASLHDLGKIAIPSEILSKPGQLTSIEFDMIKTHPQVGHDVLAEVEFPWPVSGIVLQHHERLDGSGYPAGLKEQDILPEAQIIGVADVMEAMSSHRPYRSAVGVDQALATISEHRGTFYSPQVVDICLALFEDEGFAWDED